MTEITTTTTPTTARSTTTPGTTSATGPRIALVTGANRGLGREEALALAPSVDLVITYRTHEDEARAVVAQVEALGRTAVPGGSTRASTTPSLRSSTPSSRRCAAPGAATRSTSSSTTPGTPPTRAGSIRRTSVALTASSTR